MQEFRCCKCNKLLGKIAGVAEIVCTRCKEENKKSFENEQELAELIANHLPITEESALDFVNGVMNGALLDSPANFAIALAHRDRVIDSLRKQLEKFQVVN